MPLAHYYLFYALVVQLNYLLIENSERKLFKMLNVSFDSLSEIKVIDFESIPVDTVKEKVISVQNTTDKPLTYRVTSMYTLNSIDRVFKLAVTSAAIPPAQHVDLRIEFKPNVVGQSFTDYFVLEDTDRNYFRLTVTGKCHGPKVRLDKKMLMLRTCKNVSEQRREVVNIVNKSSVETTYQWLLPQSGQGYFQVSTGNCGLIRAHETITTTIIFTGSSLGIYTAELVCLVLNQEPLFLNVIATVVLSYNPMYNISDHIFEKNYKKKGRFTHLMENNLSCLPYIPAASVCDIQLEFGLGSVTDMTKNISQSICVTNHTEEEGYIQWMPDPDNIFLIDPIASNVPPHESRMFTIRFRPKMKDEVYGYLMCADYQEKSFEEDGTKLKHTWFRIPCIGNTWGPCSEWKSAWGCPTEITMPPTVPTRTTFTNFMLSNKLDIPMCFTFKPPQGTNYVIMPMCGIVLSRGWEIISVALEPKSVGDYVENWDLIINNKQMVRIRLCGSAETSVIDMMSHGYSPTSHALYEFPPTITGCTNYSVAFLHNMTRMSIHMRVLNSVPWLGADDAGTIVMPPKEIVCYHWWFFPKEADKVYETTITLSCICLINGRPVGEPTEYFLHIQGFSELPDLRVLPKTLNLHDIVVGEKKSCKVTLYNYCSCSFTSKLYYKIDGMEDDHSGDRLQIDSPVNSLKPSTHCEVEMTVTPSGSGPRQIDITYSVLYRSEYDEIEEIQPITKTICIIWYDGIYPCVKVKRTISVKSPVILSNHCVWNIVNVDALNKAFMDCRPNRPLDVNLYAPDLCVHSGKVELIFVMGCVYGVPVPWSLRREKLCDCEMIEVKYATSWYTWKHTCVHRPMVELTPASGIVSPDNPGLIHLKFDYLSDGQNVLCYVMTLPNQRSLNLYVHIYSHIVSRGILTPLRRPVGIDDYLAVMDCGRVPINNLDPVIRILWLYNPTDVFTTWRLLRRNSSVPSDMAIRCLLYFAEVPPLGKLAIPFAFMPTEMIDYEAVFYCSFGFDIVKIIVKGQGGLPNCVETRLDVPSYKEKIIRAAHRDDVVYLSTEHITIPSMPTHSLSRDIISICNDTDHIMRFIWLPERIANIVNVVMTPCWGVLQPKSSEWITMTVYTLQEPATFTTTVSVEILDLTARREYQRNEMLRRTKTEKCNLEFIITEEGTHYPGINDSPPYVLDIEKPQPEYLAMSVSVSSRGQRDGYTRMLLKQMWEQTPPYDLLSCDLTDYGGGSDRGTGSNNMSMVDIIRIIDGILWDALHSKMFRNQIEYFSKEEIPTYKHLMKVMQTEIKPRLSRRVTSGICDAIVNKAVFHVYSLNPKHEISLLEV